MARVFNFSAGPSMLPESVLSRAAAEIMDYHGSGQSVMEMSHRSKVFEEIMDEAQNLFRSVLSVPDNYDILFLQGGASTQFAAIPLNLLNGSGKADYMLSSRPRRIKRRANTAISELSRPRKIRLSLIFPRSPAMILTPRRTMHIYA